MRSRGSSGEARYGRARRAACSSPLRPKAATARGGCGVCQGIADSGSSAAPPSSDVSKAAASSCTSRPLQRASIQSRAASKRSRLVAASMPNAANRGARKPRPSPRMTRPPDRRSRAATSSATRRGGRIGSSSDVVPSRSRSVRAAHAARVSSGDVATPGAKCISGIHTECSPSASARSTQPSSVRHSAGSRGPPREIPSETPPGASPQSFAVVLCSVVGMGVTRSAGSSARTAGSSASCPRGLRASVRDPRAGRSRDREGRRGSARGRWDSRG